MRNLGVADGNENTELNVKLAHEVFVFQNPRPQPISIGAFSRQHSGCDRTTMWQCQSTFYPQSAPESRDLQRTVHNSSRHTKNNSLGEERKYQNLFAPIIISSCENDCICLYVLQYTWHISILTHARIYLVCQSIKYTQRYFVWFCLATVII